MRFNTQPFLVLVVTAILSGLLAVGAVAQVGVFTKEDLIAYTPLWQGERFPDGRPKVSDEILERMEEVPIDDAMDYIRSKHGYENQFEGGIWFRSHDNPVMVGRAVTAYYMPIRPDVDAVNKERYKKIVKGGGNISPIVNTLVDGDVVVVDMFGKIKNGPVAGESVGLNMRERGCRGLIVNGGGHDATGMRRKIKDFNSICRGWTASHQSGVMLMGLNTPVNLGSVTVLPGDIVLTGVEGILIIPSHLAEGVVNYYDEISK